MFRTLALFTLGFAAVVSLHEPFFRLDYKYVDQFDSFYKLHWDHDGESWDSAFLACEAEDATLFYPKMTDEWTVVKNLVSAIKNKPNVSDVLVGIRDEFGFGEFITVDGLPAPFPIDRQYPDRPSCVTINSDSGSYKTVTCDQVNLPFVCKKHAVVELCPTVDTAYGYNKDVRKCYKISERKKTWSNAMLTCFLEGGSLLLIKNSIEAEIIRNQLNVENFDYFVGFRKFYPNGEYYTVKGEKFDDSFYKNWYNNNKDCGNIFKKGSVLYTQTIDCHDKKFFVCEMPPKIYTWSKLGNDLTVVEPTQSVE